MPPYNYRRTKLAHSCLNMSSIGRYTNKTYVRFLFNFPIYIYMISQFTVLAFHKLNKNRTKNCYNCYLGCSHSQNDECLISFHHSFVLCWTFFFSYSFLFYVGVFLCSILQSIDVLIIIFWILLWIMICEQTHWVLMNWWGVHIKIWWKSSALKYNKKRELSGKFSTSWS